MVASNADAGQVVLDWSIPALVERARTLLDPRRRRLLGIAGPPGSGKSTLAAELCAELGSVAARVPLDGFHLANRVLAELGLADRKGAPETFDASGFQWLLRRLRENGEQAIYAPDFFRDFEESIAASLRVDRSVPLIVVEGNYLLLEDGPWHGTATHFDEIWYLRLDDAVRQDRLVQRHLAHGRSVSEASEWTLGNDERNAVVVEATADRADVVIVTTGNG